MVFALIVITEEKKILSHKHLMVLILLSFLEYFLHFLLEAHHLSFRKTGSCKHKMQVWLELAESFCLCQISVSVFFCVRFCWFFLYFSPLFYSELEEAVHFDGKWVLKSNKPMWHLDIRKLAFKLVSYCDWAQQLLCLLQDGLPSVLFYMLVIVINDNKNRENLNFHVNNLSSSICLCACVQSAM